MRQPLPYPPIYADEPTMAALLCLGESTFRDYVRRGLLPPGRLIGSSRRWKVEDVTKALDPPAEGGSDGDPISGRIKDFVNGQEKKGKRHAA